MCNNYIKWCQLKKLKEHRLKKYKKLCKINLGYNVLITRTKEDIDKINKRINSKMGC